MIFLSRKRCTNTPKANIAGIQISSDTNGSIPPSVNDQKAPNMPNMTISPCAMLMMRMTPKTIVSPTAIMA
jgi:hypothetical protein